ncbi:MAG: translation elongation factor Ts [Chloroflexota bacterium]|nr:translation elongation factor Ts [Chloroflexota bacterium]
MAVSKESIVELRELTGAGIMDARRALEESNGDLRQAQEIIRQKGLAMAAKKGDRVAKQGLVEAYVHGGRLGALIELNCETDFVARTDDFKQLAREIAMQAAANGASDAEELRKQSYNRDTSKTIETLINETVGRVGENIVLRRVARFELGSE